VFDYLALAPIIEGAGGVITDWQGAPLTLASGDRFIAAGDARIHGAALQILAG
jgi:fructose-1,6-bisphosphatase/inositol monophosphatase family enzyme